MNKNEIKKLLEIIVSLYAPLEKLKLGIVKASKNFTPKADHPDKPADKAEGFRGSKYERFEERMRLLTETAFNVQEVLELFTENTKTTVHYIVSGFQGVLTIVHNIRSTFENIRMLLETFKTAKDVGSFLLDILPIPFAEGGRVPGHGSGDTVPAMLTPGEFVVRKGVVDKFGSSFFAWLNGGLLPSMAGKYAMGGLVPASPTPVVRNNFDVHIDRRGDVSVVQKALRKLNSNRSYFGG